MTFERYLKMLKAMLDGSLTSLEVFFLTLIFSIPLALPIAMGRMSKNKFLSGLVNVFLLIIRGTPLMLQLLVVYFGPGLFIRWLVNMGYEVNFKWNRFAAAIIALSINYAAYFAEIYRGGIESIPKGQYEASKVLGYTSGQTFFRIVLPQVIDGCKRTSGCFIQLCSVVYCRSFLFYYELGSFFYLPEDRKEACLL